MFYHLFIQCPASLGTGAIYSDVFSGHLLDRYVSLMRSQGNESPDQIK